MRCGAIALHALARRSDPIRTPPLRADSDRVVGWESDDCHVSTVTFPRAATVR
jgi:hypothetical protein